MTTSAADASHSSKADRLITFLPAILFVQPSLTGVVAHLLGSGSGVTLWKLAIASAVVLAILVSAPGILKRAHWSLWLISWFIGMSLLGGGLLNGGAHLLQRSIAADVAEGAVWMFALFAVVDYSMCRRYLYWASVVILACSGLLLITSLGSDTGAYSQYLGYQLLPAAAVFVDATFRRFPFVPVCLAACATFLMISSGARGPLIALGIFVVARFISFARVLRTTVASAICIGLMLILLLIQQRFEDLVTGLQSIVESVGLSTRALERMQERTLFVDETRTELIQHTIALIDQYSFLGVGVGNERVLLATEMGAAVDDHAVIGWYPHNLLLELCVQFGIVFGILLILVLVIVIVRAFVTDSNMDRQALLFIFLAVGVIPLLYSGSYLSWPPFFGFIGLCVSALSASQKASNEPLHPVEARK